MISDLEQLRVDKTLTCDIAIVGSGAVGMSMAVALSRAGYDVLLLEGGGTNLETKSQALYNGVSVGHPLDGLHNGRFRQLGGTTNFWGGQLVRFDPIVFGPRPWLQLVDWPIGYDDVEPYYDKLLALLGMSTCINTDEEVLNRARIYVPNLGENLEIFLTRWLRNQNFSQIFHSDLQSKKLRTVVHANVVGFGLDEGNCRIEKIALRTLSGSSAIVSARSVVLACGTIEISRLMLSPLENGKPAPWSSNDWIGRVFMDHIDCTAGYVRPLNFKEFHHLFDNIYLDGYKYNPKLKLREKAQMRYQSVGIAAAFSFFSTYSEHLANLKVFTRAVFGGRFPPNLLQMPAHLAALWRVLLPLGMRYLRANRAYNPEGGKISLRISAEQLTNKNSRIYLRHDRDALGVPIVEVDWSIDGGELETIASFAEEITAWLRSNELADVLLDERLVARDRSFLGDVDDGFHQMGGARMSESPTDGVVDSNLRVHGVANLYIAGAAVFPSSGFANPTFTAMALGQRLVEYLKGQR